MPNPTDRQRNRSVSRTKISKEKAIKAKSSSRSRVLTGNSGYAAAEFNFPQQHYSPPLIISEPNEDTSSWQ